MNKTWKVVPLSVGQLLDVREEDILEGGLYRKCNTYRGGGGYDKFPAICNRRFGFAASRQFVVQLYGCNLDCPYCYVTREGVWGNFVRVSTKDLVTAFKKSQLDVFHLMGGAPAIQIDRWPELIGELKWQRPFGLSPYHGVFHSDLMLTECKYPLDVLNYLSTTRDFAVYAVNIKGYSDDEWRLNTRKEPNWSLFNLNLQNIVSADIPFYITFTNVSPENISKFWDDHKFIPNEAVLDSFGIDLIDYEALPHVDDVSWGATEKLGEGR